MAFQSSLSQLPSVSMLGSDMWPSFSTIVSSPLKTIRRNGLSRTQSTRSFSQNARITQSGAATVGQRAILPDYLKTAPIDSLRPTSPKSYATTPLSIWMPTKNARSVAWQAAYSPTLAQRSFTTSSVMRGSSTSANSLQNTRIRPQNSVVSLVFGPGGRGRGSPQKRTFSSTFQLSNQNMLAHAERTANNNPTSASAQNAFYSALLRTNMPKLVIERYETGRYATNPAADSCYIKALQMTGSVPAPGMTPQSTGFNLGQDKLQAVGQAVAGQLKGAQITRPGSTQGTGAKEAPLYVVVEETWGSTILKWVKTLLWIGLAGYFLLVVLTIGVEMTGSLRSRTGQNNEVQPQHQTVRFTDVHGCDEAKEELQELVEFLLNPDRFNQLGGKLPKGVLLVGPPGTGKTMLAKAVAGEAGCPFFYMSGSEFDELYVGVGAKRVRDLFTQARAKAPSIIFIDELDAVGGKRNARDPAYAKQTLNQLLTELDGFSPSTGVILIAATNYPESLDSALVRPGRFDRRVTVPLPDVRGRIEILKHHMKNIPVATDVDVANLARGTSGFSGADLENLVNQAAVHASRLKYKKVIGNNFEWAKDKIIMGAEMKSRMVREKDKVMTAYHEAGHCLVSLFTPSSEQLYKMTIMPRGPSLGSTHFLPEMDAVSRGYDQYLADIDVAMGGRAAESLIYGPDKVSSGISQDVASATSIAKHLVMRFGYSSKLGNVDYSADYERLSSETKQLIESEVREIIEAARRRADNIIIEKRKELEALKDALMEFETLDKAEIEKVLRGEKLQRLVVELRSDDDDNSGNSDPKGSSPQDKKPKETSSKGGVGIKLPDVLLPGAGAGTRSGDRASER